MPGGDVSHKIVRRLSILRFFDLIDFPRPVLGAAEADNGELALVADLVEGVCRFPGRDRRGLRLHFHGTEDPK